MKARKDVPQRWPLWLAATPVILVALFTLLMGPGCAATGPTAPPDASTPYRSDQIGEGDVIQVAFPGATNLNTVVKIPVGGTIKLPFAGEFQASGRSPQGLQEDILRVFGSQLQLKEVNVTLVTSAAAVYVSGEVLRPGKVPLDRPMTVIEAVMECGGMTPQAKPGKVRVIRSENGKQIPYDVDLSKALSGEESTPFYLRPSDVINIPRKVVNF